MTNKATKYGFMTIAAVLLVALAFAGAGAATDVTITFNATIGTGNNYTQVISSGTSTPLYPVGTNFTAPAGKAFVGWATEENTKVVYLDNASVKLTADTKLYAVWNTIRNTDWTLSNDVSLTDNIVVPADVTVVIDLNGHTLKGNGNGSVIVNYGDLTLRNSKNGGCITNGSATRGGAIYVGGTGKLTLTSGVVISNNGAKTGGAIYTADDSSLVMNDGMITGNTASGSGGAIGTNGNSTFVMNGGQINGNSASTAALLISGNSSVVMNGGEIRGNTASGSGGGVYLEGTNTFTINNGKISDNWAGSNGGGIMMSAGTFNMYGGEVSNNSAVGKYGVFVYSGTFNLYDGIISNNHGRRTYPSDGGAVSTWHVSCNAYFNMYGGKIIDNTGCIGGVMNWGVCNMSGGIIQNNTAMYAAGGLSTSNNGVFNMTGGIITGNRDLNWGVDGMWVAGASVTISDNAIVTEDNLVHIDSIPLRTNGINENCGVFNIHVSNPKATASSMGKVVIGGKNMENNFVYQAGTGYVTKTFGDNLTLAPIVYNVSYDGNHGIGEMDEQNFIYDEAKKPLTVNSFTRTGYTFSGWNTKANLSGTNYADGESVQNLTTVNASIVTLYANWTAEPAKIFTNVSGTITLDPGYVVTKILVDGTSIEKISFVYNQSVVAPTRSGYEQVAFLDAFNISLVDGNFDGENATIFFNISKADLGVLDTENIVLAQLSNGIWGYLPTEIVSEDSEFVQFSAETTSFSIFYPMYMAANTYTVHFDANGGQGLMADMTFTYGEGQNLTANAFQRYNSNFLYWIYNGTKYYNTEFVNNLTNVSGGSVTMTAQWETYSTGGSSSGSTYMGGSSASYTPTQQPTVKPTVVPTVSPSTPATNQTIIAKPTTPATTSKSPAPFVGLLAGLGAAAVLLRLRK